MQSVSNRPFSRSKRQFWYLSPSGLCFLKASSLWGSTKGTGGQANEGGRVREEPQASDGDMQIVMHGRDFRQEKLTKEERKKAKLVRRKRKGRW